MCIFHSLEHSPITLHAGYEWVSAKRPEVVTNKITSIHTRNFDLICLCDSNWAALNHMAETGEIKKHLLPATRWGRRAGGRACKNMQPWPSTGTFSMVLPINSCAIAWRLLLYNRLGTISNALCGFSAWVREKDANQDEGMKCAKNKRKAITGQWGR